MNPDANYRAEAQNKFEILLDWLNPGFRLIGESTLEFLYSYIKVCTLIFYRSSEMEKLDRVRETRFIDKIFSGLFSENGMDIQRN